MSHNYRFRLKNDHGEQSERFNHGKEAMVQILTLRPAIKEFLSALDYYGSELDIAFDSDRTGVADAFNFVRLHIDEPVEIVSEYDRVVYSDVE